MKVVVIGAGLSGLAAACHLVAAGHDVTVLERESDVGGRAGRLEQDGFRFDTGPVVMTMPELAHAPIRALGLDPGDFLTMQRLDPSYRALYADGETLDVAADMGRLREAVERQFGRHDAEGLDRLVVWLEALYDAEMDTFIDTNYTTPVDLMRSPGTSARLLRLGGLRRLGPSIDRFFDDERLARLFSFQALYAGISPARARAILAVISHMDIVRGVYYPGGGMHAVPRALAAALEQSGGGIELGTTVSGLTRDSGGRVTGVVADRGEIRADAVVATLDAPVVYRTLLPDLRPPRVISRGSYSPSAVVWHVGVKGRPAPGTRHHNIHFGHDWDGAFTALIDDQTLMPDPSRLVTVPSVTDPDVAPEGHSTLYVLEPVPHEESGIDWRTEGPAMRERLHEFIEQAGYPAEVVTERLVTPADWAGMGMHLGTPFALAHTFTQSGPFRTSNVDRRVPGLVLAGSGTVPGVGVPMVLISGRLAAERVERYAASRGGAKVVAR